VVVLAPQYTELICKTKNNRFIHATGLQLSLNITADVQNVLFSPTQA